MCVLFVGLRANNVGIDTVLYQFVFLKSFFKLEISMLIYIVIFILSYLCVKIAYRRRSITAFYAFSAIAILLPSLLAGFRDITVGKDLKLYFVYGFDTLVQVKSWTELPEYFVSLGLEPLWILFHFIISRFTNDYFWPLFLQQVIVLILVSVTCYKLRKFLAPPHLFLIFLLSYFCWSMSANRQIFAIAFVFLSSIYVVYRKPIKFYICIVIAFFFHSSSVFALFLYPVFYYMLNGGRSISVFKISIVILLGGFLVLSFPIIIKFLLANGLIADKYERYADANFNTHKADIAFMCAAYLFSFANKREPVINNCIKILSIICFFLLLCGQYNDVAQRVVLYYDILLFVIILHLAKKVRNNIITYILIFMIFACFFYYPVISDGLSQSVPYISKTLGITK